MRIAGRNTFTPETLKITVSLLADRLARIGVERIPGFNLYINPEAYGCAIVLVDGRELPVDILEIDARTSSSTIVSEAWYRFVHPADFGLHRSFVEFTDMVELSSDSQREFLGNISQNRWLQFSEKVRTPELTIDERRRLVSIDNFLGLVDAVCQSSLKPIEWLTGPYPASVMTGESPAEQLQSGGTAALAALTVALIRYIENRERQNLPLAPPPRHFDAELGSS